MSHVIIYNHGYEDAFHCVLGFLFTTVFYAYWENFCLYPCSFQGVHYNLGY